MLFSYRHGAFAKLALSVGLAALIAGSARAEEPAAAPAAETAPAAAAAPAEAVDPGKVVATINGQSVTEGELALALSSVDQQYAQLAPEQRRAAAFMAILEIKLLVAKAVADGLDKDPGVEQRLVGDLEGRDRSEHPLEVLLDGHRLLVGHPGLRRRR